MGKMGFSPFFAAPDTQVQQCNNVPSLHTAAGADRGASVNAIVNSHTPTREGRSISNAPG